MSSGCGDVLSLEDLKTAKKHQLFEAEVITGKSGGVAGGADIDYATNQVTGQTQKTLPAVLRDAGFRPAPFTFTTGGTLGVNDADMAVLWPVVDGGDGAYYVWKGALPKIIPAASTPLTAGGISDSAWLPWGDITLRDELIAGGVSLGYEETDVASALNRIASRADIGLSYPTVAGWDGPGDTTLYNFKGSDVETLHRGHLGSTKKLFGLRRNASVTSFRAGDQGANGWNTQVTGVSNSLQLAQYGSPDKVGAYGDIVASAQETYQVASSVTSFTSNGFYTTNSDILANAKPGMLVNTNASPKKWNVIATIDTNTGLITCWDGWATSSGYETPAPSELVNVDPEGKLWTLNYNLIIPSGRRATGGVIAELGIINQNGVTSGNVGIDIVNLPGSTTNCDTALVLRGANTTGQRWLQSISCRHYTNYGIGFYSSGSGLAQADIKMNGDAVTAIDIDGNNTVYSLRWRVGGAGPYATTTCAGFNPQGTVMRQGMLNAVITTTASISAATKSYRLNTGDNVASSPVVITLPDSGGLVAGHEQYLKCYGVTPLNFVSANGSTLIRVPTSNTTNPPTGNDTASVVFYPTKGREYKLDWDGLSWRIWE